MSETAPDLKDEEFVRQSTDIMVGIGKAIGQIMLYNKPEHTSVQAILIEAYKLLDATLAESTKSLAFSVVGDRLLINGRLVGTTSRMPPPLLRFMLRHKVHSITFKTGLTLQDLTEFCATAIVRSVANAKAPAELLSEKGVKTVGINEAEVAVVLKGQQVTSGPDGPRKPDSEELESGRGSKGAASGVDAAFIRNNFGRYMAPELVNELAETADRLKLGGETRTLTVMFTDIRGFTSMAEEMTPQEVTQFINSFLTPMTRVIMDYGGFIDKYIGDSIMAFWNAPLEEHSHEFKACNAAISMRAALVDLNVQWMKEARERGQEFEPIQIGIGINTGDCCVGNIGSEQRFEYSAVGDTVNLASRLEGQSKIYGVDIVIGPAVQKEVPDCATLELDVVKIRGKKRPVQIFALLGHYELAQSEAFVRLSRLHQGMLEAFRGKRWDEAERFLGACRSAGFPLETLHELYQSRIDSYRLRPPAPDWDGVFTPTQK